MKEFPREIKVHAISIHGVPRDGLTLSTHVVGRALTHSVTLRSHELIRERERCLFICGVCRGERSPGPTPCDRAPLSQRTVSTPACVHTVQYMSGALWEPRIRSIFFLILALSIELIHSSDQCTTLLFKVSTSSTGSSSRKGKKYQKTNDYKKRIKIYKHKKHSKC